jgi:hypothetical protein
MQQFGVATHFAVFFCLKLNKRRLSGHKLMNNLYVCYISRFAVAYKISIRILPWKNPKKFNNSR